jgi:dolichol-phosphate mannosyltransferase
MQGQRLLRFNVVGSLGITIQLVVLTLLFKKLGVHYLLATVIAIEVSVLHNFLWHLRWTWVDRIGAGATVRRMFLRFHVTSAVVSITANLILMPLLVAGAGFPVLLANCVTIGLCGMLNYLLSDRIAFVQSES